MKCSCIVLCSAIVSVDVPVCVPVVTGGCLAKPLVPVGTVLPSCHDLTVGLCSTHRKWRIGDWNLNGALWTERNRGWLLQKQAEWRFLLPLTCLLIRPTPTLVPICKKMAPFSTNKLSIVLLHLYYYTS